MPTENTQTNAIDITNLRDPGQIRFALITVAVASAATTSVWPLGKLDPQYHCVSQRAGRARPTAAFSTETVMEPLSTETVISNASKRRLAQRSATTMLITSGNRALAEPL